MLITQSFLSITRGDVEQKFISKENVINSAESCHYLGKQ